MAASELKVVVIGKGWKEVCGSGEKKSF